jgi:hypothetical protein
MTRLRIVIIFVLFAAFVFIISCHKGHGLSPDPPGIEGIITFQGSWPDSTNMVLVVAVKQFPWHLSDNDSLTTYFLNAFISGDLAYSDPIPLNSDRYQYKLLLDPGLWERISVVWFPADLLGLKEIGSYFMDPQNQERPSAVVVLSGTIDNSIHIDADFIHVNSESPFLKVRGGGELERGGDQ